jgi:hypothetical protein
MRLRFFSLSATAALLMAIASPAAFAQTANTRPPATFGQNPSNTLNPRNCPPNQNNQSLLPQATNSSRQMSPPPSGMRAGQRLLNPLAINGENPSPRRQHLSNNSSNTPNNQTTTTRLTTIQPTTTQPTTTQPTTTQTTTTQPTTTQTTVTTNNPT